MIPKIIHYCWFGGNPLPAEAIKCINSWRKYCPDYEIKEWNESNFDYSSCEYAKEAYEAKKWAFVSDYARFKVLYENGGVYFDTDVELLKPIDPIVEKGPFMGCENAVNNAYSNSYDNATGDGLAAAPGLGLAANPGLGLFQEILDVYSKARFINVDGSLNLKTVVDYTTEILKKHGLKDKNEIQFIDGVYVYPKDFFNPMDMDSGKIIITNNTVSIHHYSATWVDNNSKFRGKVYQRITLIFGKTIAEKVRRLVGRK